MASSSLFLLLLVATCCCTLSVAQVVSFYAMGDVPYSDMDACLLPYELSKLDPSDASVLFHLGDVRGGKPHPTTGEPSECPETLYQEIADIFQFSPVTTFFLPGDNGWLDCFDAQEAYKFWETHLFTYNKRIPLDTTVYRWGDSYRSTRRSEFFSFLLEKSVLFIGLSLPDHGRNTDNEWSPRDALTRDNVEWTRENLDYFEGDAQAIVILGHDATTSFTQDFYTSFRSIIVKSSYYRNVPILVMEDGHYFEREEWFLGLSNVVRIQTDDTTTPMKVTVTPRAESYVFEHDERCKCSTRNGPRTWLTESAAWCQGACTNAHDACQWENPCRRDKECSD